jgi:hypothetical protein
VIKRGWDWLGVTPMVPDRVGGLIEAPPLAECLTLNKADFTAARRRYLAYRKALEKRCRISSLSGAAIVNDWNAHRSGRRAGQRRRVRPLDLAEDFPCSPCW